MSNTNVNPKKTATEMFEGSGQNDSSLGVSLQTKPNAEKGLSREAQKLQQHNENLRVKLSEKQAQVPIEQQPKEEEVDTAWLSGKVDLQGNPIPKGAKRELTWLGDKKDNN